MSLNWDKLRHWNGTQQTAFEELCCQLAACEKQPADANAKFVRVKAPDAGVECYWIYPDSTEWGFQAKFFKHAPDKSQWKQIDHSIEKALDKHNNLRHYTVCLPTDREDPKVHKQKWFMDKWKEHVVKWSEWAHMRGMSVDFYYWGSFEIWEKLSREEHAGRRFFWFNEEQLSNGWFTRHFEETRADVGARYTPELNVDLPIARLFEGLGRTDEFYVAFKKLLGEIAISYADSRSARAEKIAQGLFDKLGESIQPLLSILQSIDDDKFKDIPFERLQEYLSSSEKLIRPCVDTLKQAGKDNKTAASNKVEGVLYKQNMSPQTPEDYESERYRLRKLQDALMELEDLSKDSRSVLSNKPALLLSGKAGTGKTHLFCDVVKNRISADMPTVLLLGKQFNEGDPWKQIIDRLGLTCKTKEEFLGALDAAAQARQRRAIIFIDALNEGDGSGIWHKHLAGIINAISRYSTIGIALSVRSSYEDLVIPDGLVPDSITKEIHYGFSDSEYEAMKKFFEHYDIELPSVPLLMPEFQNPLFLKIFCEGLFRSNLHKVPKGRTGVSAIFNFFIDSIHDVLWKPERLNYDKSTNLVRNGVEKLAEQMALKGCRWLPIEEAIKIVNVLLPGQGETGLFRNLIHEGILSEDRYYSGDDYKRVTGISFCYEKFSDHVIASHLLDKYLRQEDAFSVNTPLGELLINQSKAYMNEGVIEALCIQIPERIGKELVDMVPESKDFRAVRFAFVDSLIWRDPAKISNETLVYVNYINRWKDTSEKIVDAFLTVATIPEHPYNARFLHKHLLKYELPKRDAWWSIYVHQQYGNRGAVDRLVDWAWSAKHSKGHLEDESVLLAGIALTWFLTTSNRFLRDRATKAITSLFSERVYLLPTLIELFLTVNDPYVSERLFAAAYGAVLRSNDTDTIGKLAQKIYEWVFMEGNPPVHILLRDYARGIIETALHQNRTLDIEAEKIRPPYGSKFPSRILSEEALKTKYYPKDIKADRGYADIWFSVMGFGDFARYVIGTNSGHFDWSSKRIGCPTKPTPKELYERFRVDLTDKQRLLLDEYEEALRDRIIAHVIIKTRKKKMPTNVNKALRALRDSLGKTKKRLFDKTIRPYLENPTKDKYRFDLSLAQRWIFKKVVDLGWTPKLFDDFDRYADRGYSRESHKAERIGKKYQWIAYHEFLARVADNFEFRKSWGEEFARYEGPWQISCRDIDPSCIIRSKNRGPHTESWWSPLQYDTWNVDLDVVSWLKTTNDLPDVKALIDVMNPNDKSEWLTLDGYYRWEQPTAPEEDRHEVSKRDIWYMLHSYIVKKNDSEKFFQWLKRQNFSGRWMPEAGDYYSHNTFLREYPWGLSCAEWENERTAEGRFGHEPLPFETIFPEIGFSYEGNTLDCSVEEGFSIRLPSRWLMKTMGLKWDANDFELRAADGSVAAYDPSFTAGGPSVLLFSKRHLLGFLQEQGYDILWTLLAEKNNIGGFSSVSDWQGRLDISGVYRFEAGRLTGDSNTWFVPSHDRGGNVKKQ
ncbi:MAG: ATP-binding protein [Nitrospirae bacterium]|nr:MAG: ATP-binding protein [Nitrospirota bacterium]